MPRARPVSWASQRPLEVGEDPILAFVTRMVDDSATGGAPMSITADEERRIQATADQLEARTGVQVLAAVIGKADHYPEVPWKAFALAAALAASVLIVRAFVAPSWFAPFDAAMDAVVVLGVGMLAAVLAACWPPLARRIVGSPRLQGEVEQYARAFFLERELFATRERNGILLLISLFERKVVVLPDSGVAARLSDGALAGVIDGMRTPLARGRRAEAVLAGLTALENALLAAGVRETAGGPDEIPSEFVEDRGEER